MTVEKRNYAAEYQALGVPGVQVNGYDTLNRFHEESIDAIKRAALASVGVCRNIDSGLRSDVAYQRKNAAIWGIKSDLQDALDAKVGVYRQIVSNEAQRLQDALAERSSDPATVMGRKLDVGEARRQIEAMGTPQRIQQLLDAAKTGNSVVMEAFTGSLTPLVPSTILTDAQEDFAAVAAPDQAKGVETARNMLREVQSVSYVGTRAINSALSLAGEYPLLVNLHAPKELPVLPYGSAPADAQSAAPIVAAARTNADSDHLDD